MQANDPLIGPKIKQFCKMQILADQGVIAVSPLWLYSGILRLKCRTKSGSRLTAGCAVYRTLTPKSHPNSSS